MACFMRRLPRPRGETLVIFFNWRLDGPQRRLDTETKGKIHCATESGGTALVAQPRSLATVPTELSGLTEIKGYLQKLLCTTGTTDKNKDVTLILQAWRLVCVPLPLTSKSAFRTHILFMFFVWLAQ